MHHRRRDFFVPPRNRRWEARRRRYRAPYALRLVKQAFHAALQTLQSPVHQSAHAMSNGWKKRRIKEYGSPTVTDRGNSRKEGGNTWPLPCAISIDGSVHLFSRRCKKSFHVKRCADGTLPTVLGVRKGKRGHGVRQLPVCDSTVRGQRREIQHKAKKMGKKDEKTGRK